jgi:hypothetical protein
MNRTRSDPLDPIIELLTTYNEINSSRIDELSEVPSALEFMRYVRLNRPFVVRGGAKDWSATQTWDIKTLKELLEGQTVQVAVTPAGYVYTPFGRRQCIERQQKRRFANTKRRRRAHLRQALGRTANLLLIHRFHLLTGAALLPVRPRSPLCTNPSVPSHVITTILLPL